MKNIIQGPLSVVMFEPEAVRRTDYLCGIRSDHPAETARTICDFGACEWPREYVVTMAKIMATAPELIGLAETIIGDTTPPDRHYKCTHCGSSDTTHAETCWIGKIRRIASACIDKATGN